MISLFFTYLVGVFCAHIYFRILLEIVQYDYNFKKLETGVKFAYIICISLSWPLVILLAIFFSYIHTQHDTAKTREFKS